MYKKNLLWSLLFFIIHSACDKIKASIVLFESCFSWNMSFVSSILAEEELAKLIILPIARELGEVKNIISNKKHNYYKHPIKQKIFTTFWLQNRSFEEIETLKQKSLYVWIDKNLKSTWHQIKPLQAKEELQHAVNLLYYFSNKLVLNAEIDEKSKEIIRKTVYLTLELLNHRLLWIISINDDLIKKQVEMMSSNTLHIDEDGTRIIMTDPFSIISLFKFCFRENYKNHLKNIGNLSYDELCQYCLNSIKL